jgi:alpha-1,2-mannosyltransferase
LLTALTCAAAGLLLPMLWNHTGIDLKVYRLGGSAMLDDPSSLYSARLRGTSMPFTYPPFGGIVMIPVSELSWPVAYGASIAVSLVALAVIWRIGLSQLLAGQRLRPAVFLAAVAGSLLVEPARETLSYGQINLILCAVIMYDVLDGKHPLRGIWIGLAAGIKLTPLVFFGLLLVTRQWRALAHAAGAFVVTVLIGFAVAPRTAAAYWTSTLTDTRRIGGLAYSGNQSWNGFLTRLSGDLSGGGRVWLLVVLVTVLGGLWLTQDLWLRGEQLASLAVCALIGLLCSPVSWSHHWVWLIPLGIALLSSTELGRRYPVPVAATWFGLTILAPIWWPPRGDERELSWNFGEILAGNAYLILSLAAALLLALGSRSSQPGQPVERIPT